MKKLLVAALFLYSAYAFAASAFFTGRQEQVQTVTYQFAWNCEYNFNGQTLWKVFKTSCPSSVEVE